jgi:predicted phosphodiesterase
MNKSALVLSDVHYGDLAHSETFGKNRPATDDELTSAAQDIVDALEENEINVGLLLILGDLTSRGSPGEYRDVYKFILILSELLKLSDEELYLTYGNHDVDWNICGIATNSPEHQQAYQLAAANIGGIFAPAGPFEVQGPVLGCGVSHLDGMDLITLNSGIECYSEQQVKHGRLGAAQFSWLQGELSKSLRPDSTKVVILHHHLLSLPYAIPVYDLSALEEGANTLKILGEIGIDLVLHGHRHHPIVHTATETTWKKPITFVCAGSYGVNSSERASGCLPNTFHVIDFETNSGEKEFEGFVTTFERNTASQWVPLRPNSDEYPLNFKQWFGSPAATTNAEHQIKELMSSIKIEFPELGHRDLPNYQSLSLDLRCLCHEKLHILIQRVAAQFELEVTGKYPSKCIVTGMSK